MTDNIDVEELELSDSELMKLLKSHGMDRRTLMKLFGFGAGVTALTGSASAKNQGGASIDPIYGAPYEASESVPGGIADEEVKLHLHFDPSTPDPPEFFFDPVGIHLSPHDVINFDVHGGLHTVTSLHPKWDEPGVFSFPNRVPTDNGFTSPLMNTDDAWLYRFIEPGIYDIMCLPHYTFGMVVRVVVTRPEDDEIPEDNYDDTLLPDKAEAVFDAPEMTPENIVTEGTVAWDDLTL